VNDNILTDCYLFTYMGNDTFLKWLSLISTIILLLWLLLLIGKGRYGSFR